MSAQNKLVNKRIRRAQRSARKDAFHSEYKEKQQAMRALVGKLRKNQLAKEVARGNRTED